MTRTKVLTIPYPEDILLSLKESPAEFEAEARLLPAVKLYEQGRWSGIRLDDTLVVEALELAGED